jgi:hypothetical protein
MYEDAFQERWDEMERRARELDPQRLKRAFAELELRAPADVVDTATARDCRRGRCGTSARRATVGTLTWAFSRRS